MYVFEVTRAIYIENISIFDTTNYKETYIDIYEEIYIAEGYL